jgi:hypothetical protein
VPRACREHGRRWSHPTRPGTSCNDDSFICQINMSSSLDKKIMCSGFVSLQALEMLAKTPQGCAERAASREAKDEWIRCDALAGWRLAGPKNSDARRTA